MTRWYCDNCGEKHSWPELPFPVDSCNQGESAILCDGCDEELMDKVKAEFAVYDSDSKASLIYSLIEDRKVT